MSDEAENQFETQAPSLPVWARPEAQQLSEQDMEKLIEAARNPSDTVLRVRREVKRMETRERAKEEESLAFLRFLHKDCPTCNGRVVDDWLRQIADVEEYNAKHGQSPGFEPRFAMRGACACDMPYSDAYKKAKKEWEEMKK